MATIKYKDTTIPVEAGQTVTLNTTDKKFTEDIVITAPAESGGGGKIYAIDWEYVGFSQVYALAAPTTIAKGQTVYGVIMSSNSGAAVESSNCDMSLKRQFPGASLYPEIQSGDIYVYEISNPTDDISITLTAAGSN